MVTGADVLIKALANAGVEVCFANPGTSEMQLVAAIDGEPRMRAILGLFEGVVTGAADGYGRMADKPALTLLHLGPGFGNGSANLHNARRAQSPVINMIGDHATYHRKFDAPLTSDIEGFASPVSDWIGHSESPEQLAEVGIAALEAANMYPGQIASFIAPADHAWSETAAAPPPMTTPSVPCVTDEAIAKTALALRRGDVSALFLGGRTLRADALWQAGRIAAATGARLISETFCARIQRGAGRVPVERLPYFGEQAAEFLQDISTLVVVGSKAPVSFFAYPNKPSYLPAETADVSTLADVRHDALDALTRLADALDAPKSPTALQTQTTHALETGPMNMLELGKVIANHLPEHAIVSDEGATNGMGAFAYTGYSAPHEWLMLTGGAIGQGLPLALGAAVACPDQKVIALQADGGAMYTVQSLWTMVRENLDVTVVLLNNSSYAILNIEMERVGVTNPTEKARSLLDLSNPTIDWVKIARGMGMAAQRVETVADFDREFADSMQQQGPRLIEVILPGYTFSNPQG
ncbi:MAG: acetolactate synthase large subunit [Luminiphilus sp.]|nr:acetolactate synthase large subunit [Luminiphilus sp.]